MVELYRFGGMVHDQDSRPINNVWVTMPESGTWTSTDARGRFVFDRVRPGLHRLMARTVDGAEVAATVSVPGEHADLVIQSPGDPTKGGRRKRA
jgi:hypothetical protein